MPEDFRVGDASAPDPAKVWQNQPTEVSKMSAQELSNRDQERQRKARFTVILSVVVGIALLIDFAWTFTWIHDVVSRIGLGVLSVWCIYFMYHTYRWSWPGRPSPDAPAGTTLQSYRGELEKQRDHARHIWRRTGLTHCFLGVALVIAPGLIQAIKAPRLLSNLAPFFALLVMWAVAFFFLRKRKRRRLQREIDELKDLERRS